MKYYRPLDDEISATWFDVKVLAAGLIAHCALLAYMLLGA